MKKITITESDLVRLVKRVLEEQTKPIPINLYQNPNDVEKYCKKIKVPKEFIDDEIPNLYKRLDEKINGEIYDKLNSHPEFESMPGSAKLKKTINKIILTIKPYLQKITSNNLYSTFGYGNYDSSADSKKILDIVYSELYNELEGDFKNRTLAKTFITKKNVKQVKNVFLFILNKFASSLEFAIKLPSIYSTFNVVGKFEKIRPRCKEVIVVVDGNLNKLVPSKQYNPKYPVQVDPSSTVVDIDGLLKPYIPKIMGIIDSYV
jgi:hypothetical protein